MLVHSCLQSKLNKSHLSDGIPKADPIIVSPVSIPSKQFNENEKAAGNKAFHLSYAKISAFRGLDSGMHLRQRVLVRSVMRECNNLLYAGKRKCDDCMNGRSVSSKKQRQGGGFAFWLSLL